MPPNSTQNLNAKLSATTSGDHRHGESGISWEASPIQSSTPPVHIVGSNSGYRGGYHLSV